MSLYFQKIQHLENIFLDKSNFVSEYFSNHSIPENDFSQEFALFEMIYYFEVYKRAVNTIKINIKIIDQFNFYQGIKDDIVKLLSNELYYNRQKMFFNDFYNHKRFDKLITNLINELNFNNFKIFDNQINKFKSLNKIVDSVNLLSCSDDRIFTNNKKVYSDNYIKKNYFTPIINKFNDNKKLWHYFNREIIQFREMYLIPNDNKNNWLFEFNIMSVKQIKKILRKKLDNKDLYSLTLMKKSIEKNVKIIDLNFLDQSIPSSLKLIELSKKYKPDHKENSFHKIIFSYKPVTPQYVHWGTDENKENEILTHFNNYLKQRHQIIDDLIELLIEDSEIDQEEKRNTIATAYFLIGKNEQAVNILGES